MTKEEQNQIIKDKLVESLQKEKDIPEDIGGIYKNWLLGKIQQASEQLKQPAQEPAQQQQEAGNGEQ